MPLGWPSVVATGLTSLLPMIPSSQPVCEVILFAGPNWMPAVGPAPVTGERYITSNILTHVGGPAAGARALRNFVIR